MRYKVITLLALLFVTFPAMSQQYNAAEIRPLPDREWVWAQDINSQNIVTGISSFQDFQFFQPFSWNGIARELVDNPYDPRRFIDSRINNNNEIIGSYNQEGVPPYFPYIYLPTPAYGLKEGVNSLPLLPDAIGGYAKSINNSGMVVGVANYSSALSTRAFLWQNMVLSELVHDGVSASADAINDVGLIAGVVKDKTDIPHPVIWQNGVISKTFGVFKDTTVVSVNSINSNGDVVGFLSNDSYAFKAILWPNWQKEPISLGTLNPKCEECHSKAFDINSSGVIVGSSTLEPFSRTKAVVWIDGKIKNLEELIVEGNLILDSANAVNDNGIIVAEGRFQGDPDIMTRSFLLTPVK